MTDLMHVFEDMKADGTAWGQLSRGGRWHAFTPSVFHDGKWDQDCNRHATYTDLALFALDVEPAEPENVCRQHACQQAWRITKASVVRRYGDDREVGATSPRPGPTAPSLPSENVSRQTDGDPSVDVGPEVS